jgi:hypothetical protein
MLKRCVFWSPPMVAMWRQLSFNAISPEALPRSRSNRERENGWGVRRWWVGTVSV